MSGYTLNPVCRSHGLPLTKLNTATQTYHCVIMGCEAWVAREMYDPEKEGEMPESKDTLEQAMEMLRRTSAEPAGAPVASTIGAMARVLLMLAEDRLHPVRMVDVEDDTDPGPEYYREQYRLRDAGHGTTTRFMDDLEQMFVTEDVGGDMNFIIYPDEGTPPGFASLSPAEVVRLHAVLTERIKSYEAEEVTDAHLKAQIEALSTPTSAEGADLIARYMYARLVDETSPETLEEYGVPQWRGTSAILDVDVMQWLRATREALALLGR